MYDIKFYNNYLFIENLSSVNLRFFKLNKVNIIYYQNPFNFDEFNKIYLWAKNKKIKLYIIDNYKLAVKYRVSGIYLTAKNKAPVFSKYFRNNFEIIGSAHNQVDYFFKIQQNCNLIMLNNPKYSYNKILNIQKFNLMSMNWKKNLCALGGINLNNIKKIQCTKVKSIAYNRAIKNPPTN